MEISPLIMKFEVAPRLIEGSLQLETNQFLNDKLVETHIKLLDLQNKALRQVLINLGWTPPEGRDNSMQWPEGRETCESCSGTGNVPKKEVMPNAKG